MKSQNYEKVFGATLGFFTNPVALSDTSVLKEYNLSLTEKEAQELCFLHDDFVRNIRDVGINVPWTEARVDVRSSEYGFQVVQERFRPEELAGEIIKSGTENEVTQTSGLILEDALKFLNSGLNGKFGFHPTVRNYAVRNGVPVYIDTFPPYPDETTTRKLMIAAAPSADARKVMRENPNILGQYTAEYYQSIPMLTGIVASTIRLRPELKKQIVDNSLKKVSSLKTGERKLVLDSIVNVDTSQAEIWKFAAQFRKN